MSLTTWQFALAGIVCAAAPLLIHLLNRRRVQVVPWAAMEYLRVAVRRQRRWLRLRDLLLLLLRMAAVLLFGLALSQPYWSDGEQAFRGELPVHAILLLDNSLSMGYQQADGMRLDDAKREARKLIQRLPPGSRVSVIPACGTESTWVTDPFDDPQHAVESLERIGVVDRQLVWSHALTAMRQARDRVPDLPPRCVWFGDQQRADWADRLDESFPTELNALQLVDVSDEGYENSWIVDVRLQDGVADVETPATILVDVAHRGDAGRDQLPVTLWIDDEAVATQLVSLTGDGTSRSVVFQHVFGAERTESGKPAFVPIRASLPADRLPADDQRWALAPVLAAVPVVFVDQYGPEEENAALQRWGETRQLRRLLAPASSEPKTRPLVRVRHLRIDQLDRAVLADARLVVIAGCPEPGPAVELLRDYVEQGGPLFLAAGANFDPAAWQSAAWLGGEGILPVPLLPTPIGATPEEAGTNLRTFGISFSSLGDQPLFRLAGVGGDALKDFYAEPYFFKAIAGEPEDAWLAAWLERQRAELTRELDTVAPLPPSGTDAERRQGQMDESGRSTPPTPEDAANPSQDKDSQEKAVRNANRSDSAAGEDRRAGGRGDFNPPHDEAVRWLLWENASAESANSAFELGEMPLDPTARQRWIDARLERLRPRTLARLDDPTTAPLLIEREIGQGRVLLFTSGVLSSWNTLPQTNAVLLLDRILRGLIEATLPRYEFPTGAEVLIPLPGVDRGTEVGLQRPGQKAWTESFRVSFVRQNQLGVIVPSALQRGIYRLTGEPVIEAGSLQAAKADGTQPDWSLDLAIQGDPTESAWEPLPPDEIAKLTAENRFIWVGDEGEISLAGHRVRARDTWWWLVLAVLVLLILEPCLLSRSRHREAADETSQRASVPRVSRR